MRFCGTSTFEYSAGSRSRLPSGCRYRSGHVLLTRIEVTRLVGEG